VTKKQDHFKCLIRVHFVNLLYVLNGIIMSTYTQILYQIVFGSKDYTPFLNTSNENMLFVYIAGILKNKKCHSYIVGGASNHIHIITHLHPIVAPATIVKDIKLACHKMILESNSMYFHFPGWQVGYSGFTYHISSKQKLIRYVENQREHHKVHSFKDELKCLLKEHSVDFIDDYLLI
jgi:putative transposase